MAIETREMGVLVDPAFEIRDGLAVASGIGELDDKIWFHKTASAVIDAGRCIGCGGCIAACPSDSITTASDGKPTLHKMCTGCSACWDYCPVAGFRPEKLATMVNGPDADEFGPVEAAYSATASEDLERAQDGGAVTALLIALLESGFIDGAVVTRRLDAFRGETVIATTADELREAAGSVYNQTNALAALGTRLPDGVERLAFVGTPCQISVLRTLQRFPWRYRESAANNVVIAIGLFCTRSFEPVALMKELMGRGEDIADVQKVDIREGKLFLHGAEGAREAGPVKEFRKASLAGCDECTDFAGRTADIVVGNMGSVPGRSSVLVRTGTGREAWAAAAPVMDVEPLDDIEPLRTMEARNRRNAIKAMQREYDPQGPLWISYSEHLADHMGTEREPVESPPFRSHHYDVSC
jgi:coenzyme F420 hydrogenase subunit beta